MADGSSPTGHVGPEGYVVDTVGADRARIPDVLVEGHRSEPASNGRPLAVGQRWKPLSKMATRPSMAWMRPSRNIIRLANATQPVQAVGSGTGS
jgi:hypothetical protein